MSLATPDPLPHDVLETTPAIDAHEVTKSFTLEGRELPILHGVSVQVQPNEMVAIMGPSGSGKSTLLHCLAGLEAPTSGPIPQGGSDLGRRSRASLAKMRRTEVGFVFQSYNLIPTLTAYENVALPYLLSGQRAPRTEILATMEELGLGHRTDSRPPSMSGGEQQRTALARVLAQQPGIVFADEPTGALDSRSGELVLEHLVRLSRQPGRAVLVVTHDPRAAAHCDRVLFLNDGRVVEEIRPDSVTEVADVLARLTAAREG